MENNYVFAPKAYNHSNLARMIINQLCVARLEFKVASALAMIGEEFDDIRKVKNNIQTFRFRSFNKQFNWKRYYSDINTTGKHFKISPLDNPSLKRMYVVNNCMRRKFRDELIKVCDLFIEKQGKIEPHQLGFDFSILDDSDLNEISVTIKNYNAPKGLSR